MKVNTNLLSAIVYAIFGAIILLTSLLLPEAKAVCIVLGAIVFVVSVTCVVLIATGVFPKVVDWVKGLFKKK